MVCELPQRREIDINPIIRDETGAVAVNARVVIEHAPRANSGSGPGVQALCRPASKAAMPLTISSWAPSTPVQPVTLTHLPSSRSL